MNESDVRYAPMTLADYQPVMALWKATPGIGLSGADSREAIGGYLGRNPGMSFVARVSGEVVGAAISGHDGRRGYLHHLAVAERCRGLGVGSQLVRRCVASLAREGIEKIHVFVHRDNDLGDVLVRRRRRLALAPDGAPCPASPGS